MGQQPFATILGCSDSRVAPELIFDAGLGEIFVIRVAGNVLSAEVAGSVQYAVSHLRTPLVVVLGHAGCGAIQAALETKYSERPAALADPAACGQHPARPWASWIPGLPPPARLAQAVESNVRCDGARHPRVARGPGAAGRRAREVRRRDL